MTDKKISHFPGRSAASAIAASQNTPEVGGDQGGFAREKCGTCFSWRKAPQLGVGQGTCMAVPPIPQAILDNNGRPIGQLATRLGRKASDEGCDLHDDGEEENDEPEGPDGGTRAQAVG